MPVIVEKQDGVALLTLSRPEQRNAWGSDFDEQLEAALDDCGQDGAIACVVLTGDEGGGAFSAGADLADPKRHRYDSPADFIEGLPRWRKFVANQLADFPKPTIAAVNGFAIGIGSIASYSCDLVVASTKAEWRTPQVGLGIMPAYGAIVRLARLIGKGNAMRAAMGYPITAEEAYRTGLAQWLVPHERLMEETLAIARNIASLPPLATRMAKESLNRGLDIPNIRDASEMDLYRFMILSQTEDSKEAHAAWRERRKPVIKGR